MMTETCAEMQTRLDSYVTARDKIILGKQVVSIHSGEKSLQYGPADVKRLDLMIREVRLAMEAKRCSGCRRRGAITYLTPSG